MTDKKAYIICAPPYNENNGGCIVMHKLCHILNNLGESAFIWPMYHVTIRRGIRQSIMELFKAKIPNTNPEFNTPVAEESMLNGDNIILYPEVINGNPVNAKNIIRWFLHIPGYHTGETNYGEDELYFAFDDFCLSEQFPIPEENRLTIIHINSSYKVTNKGKRKGSCYLLRKGQGRELVHDDWENSRQIDGLSHVEIAEIFNECEYFYSYDELTMYSQFAALCGCTSVIIPDTMQNREEWAALHPIGRYGVAYGLDDIEHAVNTRHLVKEYFDKKDQDSINAVRNFIRISGDFFH